MESSPAPDAVANDGPGSPASAGRRLTRGDAGKPDMAGAGDAENDARSIYPLAAGSQSRRSIPDWEPNGGGGWPPPPEHLARRA